MAEPARRSPSDAYVAAAARSRYPRLTAFAEGVSFEFDEFQIRGCQALEDGHGVLVCAPTGAGKTVVGEFAVHLALATGRKCFYTTPIKALSNQKFNDLVDVHGEDAVGLLTGDVAINGNAQVVVMTTEVLRNMLYAESTTLNDLGFVVMDEVHYLADRFRGAVWEEVILHLPEHVRVVGLSATVSNAEEFGEWLVEVRGDTTVVVDEHRPVPLWQHMMVGNRMFDLFADDAHSGSGVGSGSGGKPKINPSLLRRVEQTSRGSGRSPRGRGRRRGYPPAPPRWRPPSRVDVLERLDGAGLLPAIVFIFSRAGCDAAVGMCTRSGLRLTSDDEATEVRRIVDEQTAGLPEGDLAVLGFYEWRDALERGIAAHHAGLLPAFKQTVEELFVRGLCKVVFATETLALGINMPARTVVLERLVKYNGEAHVDLTPGEYTQLTGRAGRRGIDVEGHAVVLWQPGAEPEQVAGLASTRTYPLRSSFRPGYNMAVNLIDRFGAEQARDLLEQSFAQFQADRSVVGIARTIERNKSALDGYRDAADGDFDAMVEYLTLRRRISEREKLLSKSGSRARQNETAESLKTLRRGDVVSVPQGRRAGLAVIIDPGIHVDEPRPVVVTEDRWYGPLSASDFDGPVEALGRIKVPKSLVPRSPKDRRDMASRLRSSGISAPRRRKAAKDPHSDVELVSLRKAMRAHAIHGLQDREAKLRWVQRYEQLRHETAKLEEKVAAKTHSLVRAFDRIAGLLAERGYVSSDSQTITDQGKRLARIYGETDLLTAECLRHGVWEGLKPAELAAVVSTLVFEPRRDNVGEPQVPQGRVGQAWQETAKLWTDLADDERRHRLDRTREPDAGFVWPVYRWARGDSLQKVLSAASMNGQELSAGDFVRWCRQVIDLLEQLRDVMGRSDPTGAAAGDAARSLRRGVVAAGTA